MEESKSARRYADEFGGSASDVEKYMLEDAGDLREKFAQPIVDDPDVLGALKQKGVDPRKVRTFDQIRRDVIEDKVTQAFYDQEFAKLDTNLPEKERSAQAKQAARAAYTQMARDRAEALIRDVQAQQTATQGAGRRYQGVEFSAQPTDHELRQAFAQVLDTQLRSREATGRSISFKEVGRKATRERPEDIPADEPKESPTDYRAKPAVERIVREAVVPDTAELVDPIDFEKTARDLVADAELNKLKQINRVFGPRFTDASAMTYKLLDVARAVGADPLDLAKLINLETNL